MLIRTHQIGPNQLLEQLTEPIIGRSGSEAAAPDKAQTRPAPALLPPAERRRAPDTVAVALEVATRACEMAKRDPKLMAIKLGKEGDLTGTDAVLWSQTRGLSYTLSPVLWKKVQTGLSAGRVQSVAVRLIVDREQERLAFRTARYSDLEAQFSAEGRTFGGTLSRIGDVRVASGKDFDAQGVLTGKNVRLLSQADAAALVDALNRHLPWTVTNVEAKPGVERPAAPFTTSTLTQEASRKL